MKTEANIIAEYRLLKALRSNIDVFVDTVGLTAIEVFRNRHSNRDVLVSPWSSLAPDPSAPRNYDLCFHITAPDVEAARVGDVKGD